MFVVFFSRSRVLRQTILLGVAFAAAGCIRLRAAESVATDPAPTQRMLRSLNEVWVLSPDDSQQWFTIHAQAEIVFYDPHWNLLWVRTEGRVTFTPLSGLPFPFSPGQVVQFDGKIRPIDGLMGEYVKTRVVAAAPRTPLLDLEFRSAEEIARAEAHEVVYEGFVSDQSEVDAHHQLLQIVAHGRLISTRVLTSSAQGVPVLDGMVVRVAGLFMPKKDPSGSNISLDTWVNGLQDVTPLHPIRSEPGFAAPPVLTEDWPHLAPDQLVHVVGTIRSQIPGLGLVVRDATGQILIRTEQVNHAKPGTRVEAVGYPGIVGTDWTLKEAVFLPLSDTASQQLEPPPTKPRELRLTEDILEIGLDEASKSRAVHLGGVVTWSDPQADFFFIRDSSGGIRVLRDGEEPPPPAGFGIDLFGVTASGAFAPVVRSSKWRQLDKIGEPAARRVTLEQALTGIEEGQWVELRGYLRDVTVDGLWRRLEITSSAGGFLAFLPPGPDLAHLRGAVISIRGVCSAVPNDRRQLLGVELWVPSENAVRVEESPPANLFAVASQSIASLREFSTLESLNHRVRVSGVVLHQLRGSYLLIQDREEGLLVLTRGDEPLVLGDRVEVVGFPGREGSRILLREAVYRKLSSGPEPVPMPLGLGQRPINEDLDGRFVKVTASLLDVVIRPNERNLILQAGNSVFEADIALAHDAVLEVPIGSRVVLTGVYRVDYDEYRAARAFTLQLRSLADIKILKAPSWWTIERAFIVAGICGLVALLGFGWVTLLRRRVRKQTDQLREQLTKETQLEARYRDIVENASDFIFTLDRKGRFTSFNPAGEHVFGYSRKDAMGMNVRDLLAPENAEIFLPFIPWTSAADATVISQTRFLTKDRRVIWVEISARRTSDASAAYVLGVGRDVTERKQIEEQLQRARDAAEANTRAKSAFLANMSHEIRTPMNGVIGMSNLLLDTSLDDLQRDFAETIRNSADALLTVLNDILDFSKIEAGKLDLECTDFNLRETADESLELLAARSAAKGIELAALIPMDVPVDLRGDAGRIRQVLLNLIGNAIKFTERGEVLLQVSTEKKTETAAWLRVEVTDTGIGLTAEAQSRLFTPFTQADASTTRRFGGTGLGLAISRQIVELMGGEIGVRSTLGQGSTFWFTLKLDKQPNRSSRSPIPTSESLRGLRVLIVDDNATNRRIMEHYLSSAGLICEKAKDGATALKILGDAVVAGRPFHLVILDFEMPQMDGVMLATKINADPALRGVPMILGTSWDNRFHRAELEAVGIAHVLMKPIRQPELLAALLHALPVESSSTTSGPAATDSRSPLQMIAARQGLRVLVAEDNAVNQRVTLLQLQKLGYRAELVASGGEVLEALERGTYDVVLMDCHMPEMDGYEATRRIRQVPAHESLKIIAMTANAMQGDRERCLAVGMDDYISKPTRLPELQEAIARCVPLPIVES